jgi:hypothetical protein
MKNIIPLGIVIAAVAAAAVYFVQKPGRTGPRASDLVPTDAIFFAHLPDVRETAERWKKTSLYELSQEPEMQAFLERPREKLPLFQKVQAVLDRLQRVQPREGFFAVNSIEGKTPELVAGFAFSGSEKRGGSLRRRMARRAAQDATRRESRADQLRKPRDRDIHRQGSGGR